MNPKTDALILGCRQARPTGTMLAETLGWDYAEGCLAGEINKYKVIFRYGNSIAFGRSNPYGGLIINQSRSIEQSANKLNCRTILSEHGIACPKVYDINSISAIQKFPIIARPFHHSQGRNFHLCKTMDELKARMKEGYYAQDMVDKRDEFRLFILNNRIIEASIKEKMRPNADPMIRNHRRGWRFQRIRVADLNPALKNFAVSSAKVLALNWSAIDCCIANNDQPYIFEVNSAPGLIPRKAQKLAERINEWLTMGKGYHLLGRTPPHIEDEIQEAPEISEILSIENAMMPVYIPIEYRRPTATSSRTGNPIPPRRANLER